MMQIFRAGKMAHSSCELGLYPLSIRKPESSDWAAFKLAPLQAGAQFSSFGAGNSDKSGTCICQPATIDLSKQCQRGFCLAITSGADDQKRAFPEAFGLEPRLAATTSLF
jgi:hypothetical protein